MASNRKRQIAVLGAGAWGTALANLAARPTGEEETEVTLWARDAAHVAEMRATGINARHLPGVPLLSNVRPIAEPALHRLAGETRLSANIGILDQCHMMLVERVESPEFIKFDLDIGAQLPAHTTAMGKVLIAHLPQGEVRAIVEVLLKLGLSRIPLRLARPPSTY